jgi:hypothetical protein
LGPRSGGVRQGRSAALWALDLNPGTRRRVVSTRDRAGLGDHENLARCGLMRLSRRLPLSSRAIILTAVPLSVGAASLHAGYGQAAPLLRPAWEFTQLGVICHR